jgi:hypothetical protein
MLCPYDGKDRTAKAKAKAERQKRRRNGKSKAESLSGDVVGWLQHARASPSGRRRRRAAALHIGVRALRIPQMAGPRQALTAGGPSRRGWPTFITPSMFAGHDVSCPYDGKGESQSGGRRCFKLGHVALTAGASGIWGDSGIWRLFGFGGGALPQCNGSTISPACYRA